MRGPTYSVEELVQRVKAHARDHYEEGGWDILIECHTDAEIVAWIGKPMTEAGAIRKVKMESGIGIVDDRRRDIQGEIF